MTETVSQPVRRTSARRGLLTLALLIASIPALAAPPRAAEPPPARPLPLEVKPAGVESVRLILDPNPDDASERYLYDVAWRDGRRERLTPDEFAALLFHEFSGRSRWFAFLNITSAVGVAWVVLGLAGQLLFTGRMVVQWVTSERERRSVVPVAFWWMSLGGAALLIVYFVWRRDVVGVLGQSTGLFIYLRNLRLIYRRGEVL